jgi:tetratricopeptide (TPR) repeat protein
MKIKSVILLGLAMLFANALYAQLPSGPATAPTPSVAQGPMNEKDVITELKKEGAAQLMKDVGTRGVDFEMNPDVEKRLRKAKATDDVIKAVTAASPKGRAAALKAEAAATGAMVLPPEETADFKAVETELDPDKAIALAEAYVRKYPKSIALSYIYAFEGNAYENKNDVAKTVELAEKSITLKPDNLMSLLEAAYAIPQPQFTRLHAADEESQLDKAESYAKDAIKAVDDLKKLPNEQDADFANRKADYLASIHGDLGMIHLDRAQLGLMSLDTSELAKSVDEFKLATSMTQHPAGTDYYRMGEAYRLLGKYDDAIAAFTKASNIGPAVLKQYADKQIEALKNAKPTAGPPAKP